MNRQVAANHIVASKSAMTSRNSGTWRHRAGVYWMEEFRRLNDREIEQLIEFWRQEECLWKVTNKNYLDIDSRKTAMLNISKKLGEI